MATTVTPSPHGAELTRMMYLTSEELAEMASVFAGGLGLEAECEIQRRIANGTFPTYSQDPRWTDNNA